MMSLSAESHINKSAIPGTANKKAIPLCLPNNWQWNSEASECINTGERRSSLYVVDEALEKLREVKGSLLLLELELLGV